ncbi:MAG: Gfo/Idh/MocA family oxidoreductase [Ktedonobacterales bacterium]|nr:Gfo/Idh/MocA family oxidoreductase [Ktedonobacterales bacterium]
MSEGPTLAADPVRWGVLSTANIGVKEVIPALIASHNSELVAVASREVARAQGMAARTPRTRIYGSYEALLADAEVEAVYIPLPNALHAEWTIRAAEHGKHVLCEKPLGMTADEVRRMIAASQANGVLLMEAFMYRFHPRIQWALAQLAAGRVGAPRFVRATFAFDIRGRPENIRLKAALAGGSLVDVGCYPLNFACAVFGGAPRTVAARVDVSEESEVERTAAAVLDFGAGRWAMIDGSFTLPWHQHAEVIGERGRLLLPRPFTPGQAETIARVEVEDEVIERRFPAVRQYQLEVEHFAACVRSGAPVALPPEEALAQAAATEEIYRAASYRWPR